MKHSEVVRRWLVIWMYGVAGGHLLVGVLLPWIAHLPLFDAYHRSITGVFWSGEAPAAAGQMQAWWISLFGPTIQSLAIWMGVLIHLGDRQRSATVWAWLIVGVIVWAPQDMLISLRADAWVHVWIDLFAVVTMLPPLFWLWQHDRQNSTTMKASAP